jgi:hypothetical protein
MNCDQLIKALPEAMASLMKDLYLKNPASEDSKRISTHVLKMQNSFIAAVDRGVEEPADIDFWNAMVYSRTRCKWQCQFDAIRFHLNIQLGEMTNDEKRRRMFRSKKREFLTRLLLACNGTLPMIDSFIIPVTDHVLDNWLQLACGHMLLPGYADYKDVIKMNFQNPYYTCPDDIEQQKKANAVLREMDSQRKAEKKKEREEAGLEDSDREDSDQEESDRKESDRKE